MNDRPTPETDNLHQKRNVEFQGFLAQYFEMTNLARKLERERDELREQLNIARAALSSITHDMGASYLINKVALETLEKTKP